MSKETNDILKGLGEEKNGASGDSSVDEVLSRIQEERRSRVSGFKLDLQLDDEIPDPPAGEEAPVTPGGTVSEGKAEPSITDAPLPPPSAGGDYAWANAGGPPSGKGQADAGQGNAAKQTERKKTLERKTTDRKKRNRMVYRLKTFSGIIYAVLVLGVSVALACICITGGIDVVGLNKSEQKIDVLIPEGASTKEIAAILKSKGIIDHPWIFELYSKWMKKDGTYKPHGEDNPLTLSPNMGYNGVIAQLQSGKLREVVKVVIPEGYTVDDIAAELEKKGVCAASDFYTSMKNDEFDYDFINNLPPNGADDSENRIYRLEGYLFPDTYDFYTDSAAKTVITKFLDNFDNRIDTTVRSSIKASGRQITLDQVITLASIIQAEAADEPDMAGVSRVLWNRLENPAQYPRLECDATWVYINNIIEQPATVTPQQRAYYTYVREGLPVGAICNPGMAAIKAVISPSEDPKIKPCFYFASAVVGGEPTTFYSKTQQEHEQIRQKFNLYK